MNSAFAFQAVSAGTAAILRGHDKALKNPNGADNGTPLRQGKSGSAVGFRRASPASVLGQFYFGRR